MISTELDAVERLGRPRDLAQSLETLAGIRCSRGEYAEAESAALRGLKIVLDVQDQLTEAHLRCTIGDALTGLDRYAEAADSYHAALALARSTKAIEVEVRANIGLSALELSLDNPVEACRHAEQAVAFFNHLEMPMLHGSALTQLAAVHVAAGDPAAARPYAVQAVALHTESEAPLLLAKSQEILDRIG